MLDLAARPIKEVTLEPVARLLGSRFHPTQITIFGFALGLVAIFASSLGHLNTAITFWALNRILDGLDGTVARITNRLSDLGGFLDIVFDFTIYGFVPISVAYGAPYNRTFATMLSVQVLLCTFFVNNAVLVSTTDSFILFDMQFYISALVEKYKVKDVKHMTSLQMSPALIEGVESTIFFTLMLFLPGQLQMLSWLMAVGVFISIIQRCSWAINNLPQLERA